MTASSRKPLRILLTGATGQVGWELARSLAPLGEVHAPPRAELDLARPASIAAVLRATQPDVIVNPGAHTDVDGSEGAPELAHAVNAGAPAEMAAYSARTGGLLVHFSTDYVFDGRARSPYTEESPCAPLNVYGASKRAGEEAIAESGAWHFIFRTGWVYGLRGRNFLRTIRRLAAEREQLRIVDDQWGAPTWARMLAEATAVVIARALAAGPTDPRRGVYHMVGGGETTWHGFARAILEADPRRSDHRCREVVPVGTDAYPTAARRPAYSVLDASRLARDFGVRLPEWRRQLELALAEA